MRRVADVAAKKWGTAKPAKLSDEKLREIKQESLELKEEAIEIVMRYEKHATAEQRRRYITL